MTRPRGGTRRPARTTVRARRRRAGVATAVVVGLAAAGGGLWAWQRAGEVPAMERCSATTDGTEWYLSPAQAQNAALVAGASVRRGLPARAATIALATALQESKLINIEYGDRDSLGLFQQRPSQGWGTAEQIADPVYATDTFYDALVKVRGYADMEITDAAQAVQRSGFPAAYAQHEARSRAWASALTGHSPATVSCELDPVDAPRPAQESGHAVAELAARDLGLSADAVEVGRPDAERLPVTLRAADLPTGDAPRAAWAAAHWAVTTAWQTQVVEVRVADRVWTRAGAVRAADGDEAAWARTPDRTPEGVVELRVAVAG